MRRTEEGKAPAELLIQLSSMRRPPLDGVRRPRQAAVANPIQSLLPETIKGFLVDSMGQENIFQGQRIENESMFGKTQTLSGIEGPKGVYMVQMDMNQVKVKQATAEKQSPKSQPPNVPMFQVPSK